MTVSHNNLDSKRWSQATQVGRALPDGYMLLMATNSTHSAAPSLMRNLAYDPLRDFSPVSRAGSSQSVILLSARASISCSRAAAVMDVLLARRTFCPTPSSMTRS